MKEKIRKFMDDLLKDVTKTRKMLELKEELIGNMEERYDDLISQGYREEDAYQCALDSVGDVKELFREFADSSAGEYGEKRMAENLDDRKKRAFLHAVGVSLYIIGFAIWMLIVAIGFGVGTSQYDLFGLIGFIVMLIFAAIATGIMVYCSNMYPKYKKQDDSLVEEFKEWKSGNTRNKEVKHAVSSVIWLVATILYFLISFGTGAWYITWLIWLIAPCVQTIINLMMSQKQ